MLPVGLVEQGDGRGSLTRLPEGSSRTINYANMPMLLTEEVPVVDADLGV